MTAGGLSHHVVVTGATGWRHQQGEVEDTLKSGCIMWILGNTKH